MEKVKYDRITRELISSLSDRDLPFALSDYFWSTVNNSGNKAEKVLAALPNGFSVLYHLFTINGQVFNGGFNQYFFNGYDDCATQQSEALKAIGATNHLRIFQDAFETREKERSDQELQRLYAERTLQSFSKTYKKTSLNECDDEWYAFDNEFYELLTRFIREHVDMFVTSE